MKTAIIIDGANLHESLNAIGLQIDYFQLKQQFGWQGEPPIIRYYTAVHTDQATGLTDLKPYLDWLKYNGVAVIEKPTKVSFYDNEQVIKGNMDVEIAVDTMILAEQKLFQKYVFFTGDGDFVHLFRHLRRLGNHLSLVSTSNHVDSRDYRTKNRCTIVADELRKECDVFINMNDMTSSSAQFLTAPKVIAKE